MPTYDYKCRNCGHIFEVFEGMMERTETCPKCKFTNCVERQIGAGSAVIFKGPGFYCNDYKNKTISGG